MQQVKDIKYLGEILSSNLPESVHQTVLKRVNIARLSIYEIRAVIEDRRASIVGGANIGLELWKASVEQMVFYSLETWLDIRKKTLKILDNLYNCFFRTFSRIGTGASIPNFYIQTGMLNPQNIILMRQLNVYHHLANLSPRSLGNQIFNLQLEHPSLPSLIKDSEEHLTKLGIPDPTSVSKYVWNKK